MIPAVPCTLLEAIARQEGFYAEGPPNRPQRNNNPLDLEWHMWMVSYGSTQGDPRFAIFPEPQQGFEAGRHLFTLPLYRGKTISQAINLFAPGNENDTKVYILNVCAWTEKTPDTIIDGIVG